MEITIVPAWRRPAFLEAALRRLVIADDGRMVFWITVDRGHDNRVMKVIRGFEERLRGRLRIRQPRHSYRGNSYNLLTAYREAIDIPGVELIHMVEEDILVGADYYDFHRSAHELFDDAFAVSACRNQYFVPGHDPDPEADRAYCWGGYQSLGVSFRPERLAVVLPHVNNAYFRAPVAYCQRRFPQSLIPAGNAEQDGLLNRLCEDESGFVVYPWLPRAYHAGFVGYHRNGALIPGNVQEQADRILSMTAAELNASAHSYPDHTTIDLDSRPGPVHKVVDWP